MTGSRGQSSHETPRYEIRAVTVADKPDLLELARFLDTVNLPNDPKAIDPIIEQSDQSFGETIGDPRRREYVFALHDLEEKRAVGTSLIVGQLGRRDAPYIYFQVGTEERYSATLDRHFVHQVLSMRYSYNGPTEIGGLVMHPEYRRIGARLGMQISYVRFLWIAMNRSSFQNYVLAELLPPLEKDGTSYLWEAVGRHFTGMSYREADRLSKRNKEFIRGLFPDGDVYATLLPPAAQQVIGRVGPQTKGVEKLLRRIGFRYVDRVDPFDGGPHFVAPTDEISLVRETRCVQVHPADRKVGEVGPDRGLLGVRYDGAPWFRAVATSYLSIEGGDAVSIPVATLAHLGLDAGATAWLLPFS